MQFTRYDEDAGYCSFDAGAQKDAETALAPAEILISDRYTV